MPLFLLLFMLTSILSLAHEAHHQETPTAVSQMPTQKSAVEEINSSYIKNIRPIFVTKCFDCHSQQTRFPWYYRLPIAKQLIDSDIREGLKHLDMTDGFPFKGHHPTEEQLEAIRKVTEKGDMPLWRYRLLNPGTGLTPEEKSAVLEWVKSSKAILSNFQTGHGEPGLR